MSMTVVGSVRAFRLFVILNELYIYLCPVSRADQQISRKEPQASDAIVSLAGPPCHEPIVDRCPTPDGENMLLHAFPSVYSVSTTVRARSFLPHHVQ